MTFIGNIIVVVWPSTHMSTCDCPRGSVYTFFFYIIICVCVIDCMGSEQRSEAGVQAVLGCGPGCHLHPLGESQAG